MDTDRPAQRRIAGRVRTTAMLVAVALFVLGAAVPAQAKVPRAASAPAPAPDPDPAPEPSETEQHCNAYVLDERPSGELVLSEPECYERFSSAMFAGTNGAWRLPYDAPVGVLESPTAAAHYPGMETLLSHTSPLATHYKLKNGGGSSITIWGSTCSGYWNTWSSWDNSISSTYNACYRITHYDMPWLMGGSVATVGFYLHNSPSSMNDRAESIKYSNP